MASVKAERSEKSMGELLVAERSLERSEGEMKVGVEEEEEEEEEDEAEESSL